MERPLKKPRRLGPDGFDDKPASRYRSVAGFVSGFGDARKREPTTTSSKPLKVLKPPVLRPTPDRPPSPVDKPRSILKPPIIAVKPVALKPVALRPVAPPPPPPLPHASPERPMMRTILTTSVAQATDPTKEGTGAELLSLFLQQHGHGFVSATDRERQRGVMVSPDKRSRGKEPKFVRGGLAERARDRVSCSTTDFVLWKRQLEQKIESGVRFGFDMRLHIMKVLDVGAPEQRSHNPRSGLALCRLMRCDPRAGPDLTLGTYVVVFHFATSDRLSGVERFEQGNDALVWLPWHKVELVGVEACARLLAGFRALDALTPPHCLLVLSRFRIVPGRM